MNPYGDDSFVLSDKLPELKPILESWLKVQRAYNSAVEDSGETAWAYGERSCIGFLSAAVWDCKGVAVIESPTQKKGPCGPGYGRNDLYIFRSKQHIVIEAKYMASNPANTIENDLNSIRFMLAAACREVSLLPIGEPTLHLGILFVVCTFPPHDGRDFDADIEQWLQDVATIEHDAMAWLFQPRKSIQGTSTEWVSPGILLLAGTPN